MLCELKVENLALIESLHLRFKEQHGLVVMTGETGAGKSIMLRAIKLLTGGRASVDWVRSGAESCVVEALFEFDASYTAVLKKLEKGGFATDTTIIVKRIISANGRSRLYINGGLAPAKTVAELTAHLLNMASQHDQQQLLTVSSHLDYLDTMGEIWGDREVFQKLFKQWQQKKSELKELREAEQDKEQRKDFLQYQLDEIREAVVSTGEDEQLAAERKRLKSADNLLQLSRENMHLLSGTVVNDLVQVRRNMEQLVQLDDGAAELAEEFSDYSYQVEDFVHKMREYKDSLEINPMRLDQVTERLDILQQLKRKYGQSLEEVLAFAEQAEQELQHLDSVEQHIGELETKVAELEQELVKQGGKLSARRVETGRKLEQAMEAEMATLAFNQASLKVVFGEVSQDLDEVRATGWDRVEFFFSPNPGEPPRALARIASGGELSRLMLGMKCILAKKDLVETVIFDEVDSGIGGEAAEAVARKIQELAQHHQVFCISHLPQIAARGTEHFLVKKAVEDGRTASSITVLKEKERVNELARMLAGDSVTEQTQAWAEELLRKGSMQL